MDNEIMKALEELTIRVKSNRFNIEDLNEYADTYAEEISEQVSPYVAIRIAKNLISLDSDSVGINDLKDFYEEFNDFPFEPFGWLLKFEIDRHKSDKDKNDFLHFFTRMLRTLLPAYDLFKLYAYLQKEVKTKLKEMGENTDV